MILTTFPFFLVFYYIFAYLHACICLGVPQCMPGSRRTPCWSSPRDWTQVNLVAGTFISHPLYLLCHSEVSFHEPGSFKECILHVSYFVQYILIWETFPLLNWVYSYMSSMPKEIKSFSCMESGKCTQLRYWCFRSYVNFDKFKVICAIFFIVLLLFCLLQLIRIV